MIFTLVSNALDEANRCVSTPSVLWYTRSQHALPRTTYLYWLAFGPHCMRFIAPRIAAGLMGVGLLEPFWLGIGVIALMSSIIPLVVESNRTRPRKISSNDYLPISRSEGRESETFSRSSSREGSENALAPRPISRQASGETPSRDEPPNNIRQRVSKFLLANFYDITTFLRVPKVLFCLSTVFLKRIGFASSAFAFQYVSERFGWQLHQTTWLRVVSGAGAIAIGIAAPTITTYVIRTGAYPPLVDLSSIRAALTILCVSFFATWKAASSAMIMFCNVFLLGPMGLATNVRSNVRDRVWGGSGTRITRVHFLRSRVNQQLESVHDLCVLRCRGRAHGRTADSATTGYR